MSFRPTPLFLLSVSLLVTGSALAPVQAKDAPDAANSKDRASSEHVWMAEQVASDDPLGLKPQSEKKQKRKPVRRFIKGVGTELGKSADYFGKDLFMFLSVQDIDPYEKDHPDFSKPCDVLKYQLVDGSQATLRRYPDRSFRVFGSIFDGTVMIPAAGDDYVIKYPNGTRGKVVTQGSLVKVYRPDDTITTFKKTMSGRYEVSNDKLGYMGTATPDRTGISWED